MNHRVGRTLFGLVFGLGVAIFAYSWITDPAPRERRAVEERVVHAAREHLVVAVGNGAIEIVDPLSPNRKVGKVYIYAEGPGWAVSGHYRRGQDDRWYAYLMHLTTELELQSLKAEDAALDIK